MLSAATDRAAIGLRRRKRIRYLSWQRLPRAGIKVGRVGRFSNYAPKFDFIFLVQRLSLAMLLSQIVMHSLFKLYSMLFESKRTALTVGSDSPRLMLMV